MKKILSLGLAILVVLSLLSFAGCGKAETLKFGMGVYSYYEKATDADGDTNGEGQVSENAAAVLLDADGKIVKCALDTAQNKVAWTSEGKMVDAGEFKTKYELGDDYGMVALGMATVEWDDQVTAFTELVIGKTVDEVKALVAGDDGKGSDEVIKAGCTIVVSDFVKAIEKAVANAAESEATAEDTLKVGTVSSASYSNKDASEEAEGLYEVDTHFVAAVVNADKKVVVSKTDAVQANFTFDIKGKATLDTATEIKTKLELGTDYGMAAYGQSQDKNGDGVVKEWNEQAAAFDAACAGKTADEISALAVDGYGTEDLQTAGCTIAVGDMVKAAVKAATVA